MFSPHSAFANCPFSGPFIERNTQPLVDAVVRSAEHMAAFGRDDAAKAVFSIYSSVEAPADPSDPELRNKRVSKMDGWKLCNI